MFPQLGFLRSEIKIGIKFVIRDHNFVQKTGSSRKQYTMSRDLKSENAHMFVKIVVMAISAAIDAEVHVT